MDRGPHSQEEETLSAPQEQECFQSRKHCSVEGNFCVERSRRSPPPTPGVGKGRVKRGERRVGEAADHKMGQSGLKPLEWTMLTPPFNL